MNNGDMSSWDEDDILGPDGVDEDLQDDSGEPLRFRNFQQACPACGKPITDEMDSCPYCGDILFRHLRHGTFVPRRGVWSRLFAAVVIGLIALGTLMFILAVLR